MDPRHQAGDEPDRRRDTSATDASNSVPGPTLIGTPAQRDPVGRELSSRASRV